MRITARIVSSGKWWTFHLPTPKMDELFPLREDGKRNANMDAVRIALNHPDYITHSRKDTPYLQCMAAQLLVKMGEWKDENTIGRENKDYDRAVARLERKEDRAEEADDAAEVLTYARAEFTVRYDEQGCQIVRFGCTTRKEDGIVEQKPWERMCAWLMTEAAKIVSEECVDCGYPPLEFTDEAEAFYAELLEWRKRDRAERFVAWANERRLMCRCRCASGHCSPCHPRCRFYERGMCVDVKEVK